MTSMINPGMIESAGEIGTTPVAGNLQRRIETIDAIKLLLARDKVEEARAYFHSEWERAEKAIKEYDVSQHRVMKERHDKYIKGRDEPVKRWKLAAPWQKKIVDSRVAFVFGKPVNLLQRSQGTEEAFLEIDHAWAKLRMAGMNRELSRYLFKETEVARLYYAEKTEKGFRLKFMHLANSLGDRLYTYFDRYKALQAFAREYKFKEGPRNIHRFDVYTDTTIYYCEREDSNEDNAWGVDPQPNVIGKIPIAYYSQPEAEWSDVQSMIERLEWLASTRGDVNDATADPILVLKGEVVSLPDRQETAKVVRLEIGAEADYLHPQMSVEMVKDERQNLKQQIHYHTNTPDLSMDAVGGVDGRSGEAIKMLFFSAMLAAQAKQETFDPMLDREISIQRAFYAKLIMPELSQQFEALEIALDFGNPMPDNLRDMADVLTRAVAAEILSKESANRILSSLLHLDEDKEADTLTTEIEIAARAEQEQEMNRFVV